MRFMIIRKADAQTEAEALPSQELIEAMLKYNEEMAKAGVFVGGDGLRASARGMRVSFKNGKPTVVDGPFAEAKELIAGFTLIEVASKAEALEWVKRWPVEDGDGHVELEVRQLFEMEDFGPALTPELKALEQNLRETASGKPRQ